MSDEWFEFLHSNKELGNGAYTLPVFGVAWFAAEYFEGPPAFETFGLWGERSMRGFLVGAPPVILGQKLTGGSRPYENNETSPWNTFVTRVNMSQKCKMAVAAILDQRQSIQVH